MGEKATPNLPITPNTPFLTALSQSADRLHAAFYTPGHRRGQASPIGLMDLLGAQVFRADLPELPELDNLLAPQGVLQAAQALAAQTFGADRTWFLVNGSTCGVIAAILATCSPGDPIILPRNVHRSVISGLILSGAVPIFLQPAYDPKSGIAHGLSPAAIKAALNRHPTAKAVLLVSPTYYGVCGDIAPIAQICHDQGVPLLVDEAHGAHFQFHPALPQSALAAGADVSVQSTHKTLTALTQASMLHLRGDRVCGDRITQALQLVQSTSPSALLLASLDAAREQMATEGEALMGRTLELADKARFHLSRVAGLALLTPEQAGSPGFAALDRTRLTVSIAGLDGFSADEQLHQQFGVTAEFPSLHHLTFIISLGNTLADIEQLISALTALTTAQQSNLSDRFPSPISALPDLPELVISPRQAFFAPRVTVPIEQATDRICAECLCPYPPGIPVLLPGERISQAAIGQLQEIQQAGGWISGCADVEFKTVQVAQSE